MSDNKKYYYLKFKENFFDSEAMIILESMPDGYFYSNILIKLYLRSLKNEGKLMFNNTIPYNSTILAQVVRHNVGVVEKALDIFKKLGLIEMLDNGAIYMLEIQNYIGQSSNEADRQRDYQNRIKKDALGLPDKSCKKSNRIPTPEIEIEIEIKLKTNINIIIDYFNEKTNKNKYKSGSDLSTLKKYINEMIKSGDTIDNIKILIDYKLANPNTKTIDLLSWVNTKFVGQNMSAALDWHNNGRKMIIDFNKPKKIEGIFKQEDYTTDKVIKVIGFAPNQDTNKF